MFNFAKKWRGAKPPPPPSVLTPVSLLYDTWSFIFAVYVFLGDLNGVVDLMTNLYDRGLLDTGEYIVIFVDHVTFDRTDTLKYFKRKLQNDMYNVHFVKITSCI